MWELCVTQRFGARRFVVFRIHTIRFDFLGSDFVLHEGPVGLHAILNLTNTLKQWWSVRLPCGTA